MPLQPGGRDRRSRASHGDASEGVDDGNGIATPGRGLMKLEGWLVLDNRRRNEGGRGRVEREAGGDGLRLLGGRRLRRIAGKRRALRRGNGDEVCLGEETRAKLHVILEIKRTYGFKLGAEEGEGGRFIDLLDAADTTELTMRVLGDGEASVSAIATAVVAVGDGAGLGRNGAVWIVRSHCL